MLGALSGNTGSLEPTPLRAQGYAGARSVSPDREPTFDGPVLDSHHSYQHHPGMEISWQMRAAAAVVLASLLAMSDGTVFWSQFLPSVLTVVAVGLAALAWRQRRQLSSS
jgi:hypothetical protein